MRVRSLAALLACAAGCQGAVGTIDLQIVTAPGSTVMDDVQHIRLTLTNPDKVIEADRVGGSFDLQLEVNAHGQNGQVYFEGFDAGDTLVASGRTAPLPIGAVDETVKIYVAPPVSLQEAPVTMPTALSERGASRLTYGVLYAGGRDASGAPSDEAVIYNVYDHALQAGEPLPAARAGPSVMTASYGRVIIFGGEDDTGAPSADGWEFDTNVAPAGAYTPMSTQSTLARAGARAVPIDTDAFMVLGDPLVYIDAIANSAAPFDGADPLDGAAVSVILGGRVYTLIAGADAGVTGATLRIANEFRELPNAPAELSRTGHDAALLPDGTILIVGGATGAGIQASGIRYDVAQDQFTVIADMLETPRNDAAVAATDDYVVVAGGTDETGTVVGTAEVFDATTLDRVAVLPMVVPRTLATARRMANGQVIVTGGVNANGAPTDVIELFTP